MSVDDKLVSTSRMKPEIGFCCKFCITELVFQHEIVDVNEWMGTVWIAKDEVQRFPHVKNWPWRSFDRRIQI